jgi:hypothetical protein
MRLKSPIALTVLATLMTVAVPSTPGMAILSPATAEIGVPKDGTIEFAVYRKGEQIGSHKLTFQEKGDRLQVHVDVNLKVQVLFMTVYRYKHESTELWSGDRMVAFESSTRQNGKAWEVAAHLTGDDKLVVSANDQQRTLPDSLPPTSYWRPEMMQTSRWFNTQFGSPIDVQIEPRGSEQVQSVGKPVSAHRYKVTGVVAETGKPVDLDLWYADNGELVRMQFIAVADGSLIEFERIS